MSKTHHNFTIQHTSIAMFVKNYEIYVVYHTIRRLIGRRTTFRRLIGRLFVGILPLPLLLYPY